MFDKLMVLCSSYVIPRCNYIMLEFYLFIFTKFNTIKIKVHKILYSINDLKNELFINLFLVHDLDQKHDSLQMARYSSIQLTNNQSNWLGILFYNGVLVIWW